MTTWFDIDKAEYTCLYCGSRYTTQGYDSLGKVGGCPCGRDGIGGNKFQVHSVMIDENEAKLKYPECFIRGKLDK